MTLVTEDQPKPKLRVQWPKLIGGASLTALAIWCGLMDLVNNATFGVQKSPTIAGIFIAAAIGLMLLPVMANGWKDVHAWFMVVVCGIISMFAGFQNHMASQRNHDLEQAAITTRYNQAQAAIVSAEEDARQAKADIAGNGEMMGSEELSRIYAEAKGRRDVEMSADRGAKCGRNCRAAEKLMDETLPRIAAAKAKEDAQGRLDAALARMTAEKSSAPAAPKQAGATAAEETVMAVILLLASIVGATFFERGVKEIKGAVSWEAPGKKRAAPVASQPMAIVPGAKGLPAFIGLCKHGEMVPIKEAHAALERWWKATGQKGVLPAARTLSAALEKAGFEKQVDRNKRSFFAVKAPEAGLRLVAGQDA